jgi:hypothetical protein
VRWKNNILKLRLCKNGENDELLELYDERASFLLKCYGPVKFGDTGKVIPTT